MPEPIVVKTWKREVLEMTILYVSPLILLLLIWALCPFGEQTWLQWFLGINEAIAVPVATVVPESE